MKKHLKGFNIFVSSSRWRHVIKCERASEDEKAEERFDLFV